MLKKFIVCDFFLEIAGHCLNLDTNFGQFKRMCLMHFDKKNSNNNVFVTMNASEHIMQQSPFHVTYIACCKDFANFKLVCLTKLYFNCL